MNENLSERIMSLRDEALQRIDPNWVYAEGEREWTIPDSVINSLDEISHYDGEQMFYNDIFIRGIADDAITLLKEQDELLRKLQKDKDKLCLEVSEWKHKFHDAPPKFVSQGVVDQIRWERDTALSQLEQIGKGLGSKMDDIIALLKKQEAVEPILDSFLHKRCPLCRTLLKGKYCHECGQVVKWE